ncbi:MULTISPECIES: pro-sigmaK processing inhibitor BofA family protein [Sporosarcina]|uniref:Pro-sigmaK processing inhibitor BofA family protein n=1 Tax=Sporosarcina saromensis TaxID=359365 RepID=A0ABU4GFZ4_9BACL|nr:pro-sigmaK processing inhibitor BofA family protein [Sporosarcina saromensis]MDW0115210.1 pro-sigmaK processing inhibitor BofA family protein [Sporosarcina saromensis]
MKIIGVAVIGVILLSLLMLDKKQIAKATEKLSIFWFRLAFAFLALFILNIAGGFVGIYFPVNIASGFLLAILGIPGFAALFAFAVFL